MNYDDTCEQSILQHAKKLVGKNIDEILSLADTPIKLNIKNKGSIGLLIEEHWFGIKPNNSPLPDFDKVGIELKVIPLTQQKNKIAVKERTKICTINYEELILEEWESSHAKKKLNKILFIYYLYHKDDIKQSKIKKISLWKLKDNHNEMIIQNDWYTVQQKVLDGLAHNLSERDSKILAASRSGQGGKNKDGIEKDLVKQPNKLYHDKALKRAFSLKQSFTNQYWLEISTKIKYESIINSLNITNLDNFERDILNRLNALEGKSIKALSQEFDIRVGNGKNRVATVIKKMIGFKNVQSKIKEFEQLGIDVKMINVRKDTNYPCEAISFPTMRLREFINEDWGESTLVRYIEKILFIPIYKDKCKISSLNEHILGRCFFWSPSKNEEIIIKKEWLQYQDEVKNGKCKVECMTTRNTRGYREVTALSKESDTTIIHIRPHGRDSNDRDEDGFGNILVKQSFWLNKKFIQKLLNQEQ